MWLLIWIDIWIYWVFLRGEDMVHLKSASVAAVGTWLFERNLRSLCWSERCSLDPKLVL